MGWKSGYLEYVRELDRAVRELYGSRLTSLVLYGSVARGDHRPDSDVDVLVVVKDPPRGWAQRKDEFRPVTDRLRGLERELARTGAYPHLSFLILSAEEASHTRPLYLDLTEDARMLFDKDRYMKTILDGLKGRMRELGSRRVYVGDMWYWDLKPGMRFGEVIEL